MNNALPIHSDVYGLNAESSLQKTCATAPVFWQRDLARQVAQLNPLRRACCWLQALPTTLRMQPQPLFGTTLAAVVEDQPGEDSAVQAHAERRSPSGLQPVPLNSGESSNRIPQPSLSRRVQPAAAIASGRRTHDHNSLVQKNPALTPPLQLAAKASSDLLRRSAKPSERLEQPQIQSVQRSRSTLAASTHLTSDHPGANRQKRVEKLLSQPVNRLPVASHSSDSTHHQRWMETVAQRTHSRLQQQQKSLVSHSTQALRQDLHSEETSMLLKHEQSGAIGAGNARSSANAKHSAQLREQWSLLLTGQTASQPCSQTEPILV